MFFVALSLVAGISLSAFLPSPGLLAVAVAVAATVGFHVWSHRHGRHWHAAGLKWAIAGSFALAGWALGDNSGGVAPTDPSLHIGEEVAAVGFVRDEVRPTKTGHKAVFHCEQPYEGDVMLYLPSHLSPPKVNDRLEVSLHLQAHPGSFPGYANWLRHQGIHASAKAREYRKVGVETGFRPAMADLRGTISAQFAAVFPDPVMGGLCRAMLLGDRTGLDNDIRRDFAATGLSHIVAISGMNFAIIYIVLCFLLSPLLRLPHGKQVRAVVVVITMAFFALLTGANPAVVRAAIMLSMLEIGQSFWQRGQSITALATSALIFLCLDPQALFAPDFQLSYGAVLGILTLERPILAYMRLRLPKFPRSIASAMAVTLAAQAATTPMVAWHFQSFPTYFLLANLVVLPVVTLIVQVGFAGFLLAWVPGLCDFWAGVMDAMLWAVTHIAWLMAQLPGATITALEASQVGIWALLGQLAVFFLVLERKQLPRTWAALRSQGGQAADEIHLRGLRLRAMALPAAMLWALLGFLH